jgi:hypothetical protein
MSTAAARSAEITIRAEAVHPEPLYCGGCVLSTSDDGAGLFQPRSKWCIRQI